jgi:hypothetical protein
MASPIASTERPAPRTLDNRSPQNAPEQATGAAGAEEEAQLAFRPVQFLNQEKRQHRDRACRREVHEPAGDSDRT